MLQKVVETATIIKPLVQVIQGKDINEFGQETQAMIKYVDSISEFSLNLYFLCRTLRGETTSLQLDSVWKELQTHVDHVIDK